jgi:hypothetical protein
MGCNAHNHPPQCSCGFGGDTGGGWAVNRDANFSLGWVNDSNGALESFTIPNVRCPVCTKRVFFYVSPYGGRVFFDDLGPPWPKHGCTDNGAAPLKSVDVVRWSNPAWMALGWEPFQEWILWGLRHYKRLLGRFGDRGIEITLLRDQVFDRGPIFLREVKNAEGLYEISFLSTDVFGLTRDRTEFAFDTRLAPLGRSLLLKACSGDSAARAAISRFILRELRQSEWASTYLKKVRTPT